MWKRIQGLHSPLPLIFEEHWRMCILNGIDLDCKGRKQGRRKILQDPVRMLIYMEREHREILKRFAVGLTANAGYEVSVAAIMRQAVLDMMTDTGII